MIYDYFSQLKQYVDENYIVTESSQKLTDIAVSNVLGFPINCSVKTLYERYESFSLLWLNMERRYLGSIYFVGYNRLDEEHENLIEIMSESYDVNEDELNIVEDILNWYPLIKFLNGDAFCLDFRNGNIVFYEHEVFEGEKNLHGLIISTSLNDLFEKWSKIHFIDYYYWDEVVNSEGIDLTSNALQELMNL
jgi:hypothetical protein